MNLKSTIFSIFIISSGLTSIYADEYQRGFTSSRTCTRNEYREEYIPGTKNNPGYVKHWENTIEVPRPTHGSKTSPRVNSTKTKENIDTNDCSEGTIAGGILGGGLATAISRGKDRWWAIPAGVIGGSMVGCEIDGG